MLIVLDILDILLTVLTWFIIAQIVLSWLVAFNVINLHNEFVRQLVESLRRITEPLYRPIRRVLPDFGMLDLSPMIVLLVIFILRDSVIQRLKFQFY